MNFNKAFLITFILIPKFKHMLIAATEFNILYLPIKFKLKFLINTFFPKKFLIAKSNLLFLKLYFGLVI